jgi:hypothetical protein
MTLNPKLENMANNRLNIMDLHRKINQKTEKKSVCYDRVLEICNKRIEAQADMLKLSCVFEFPEYMVGYPLFDLNSCMEYCKKHLIANGFYVKYYFPDKFYISWDFEEIKRQKEEERKKIPLVAMLPPPTQTKPQVLLSDKPFNAGNSDGSSASASPHQSTPLHQLQPLQPLQPLQQPQQLPSSNSVIKANKAPQFPPDLHAKITSPLPTAAPKYDPFDVYTGYGGPSHSGDLHTGSKVSSAIENTFFTKDFKQMLTSSIGNNKAIFDYKPSGKVALNL